MTERQIGMKYIKSKKVNKKTMMKLFTNQLYKILF